MRILITQPEHQAPGKLADAELHFGAEEGALDGLKLVGFAVWEPRDGAGRSVTFPSRPYSVDGKRRSFALLRATADHAAADRIRDAILAAYAAAPKEKTGPKKLGAATVPNSQVVTKKESSVSGKVEDENRSARGREPAKRP